MNNLIGITISMINVQKKLALLRRAKRFLTENALITMYNLLVLHISLIARQYGTTEISPTLAN